MIFRRITPLVLAFVLWLGVAGAEEPKLPIALEKPAPENVEDLKAIQKQVKLVLEKVMPCTVGLRIGQGSGSGVIISKDGYVLTAGHVNGKADREATVILQDGRKLKGKTLGANHGIDSGLIKITEEGDWPFVDMGKSEELKQGQWCIAIGHPGGFKTGRTPVVRLGRILINNKNALTSDCTLVGGDSGGPLFDMAGKVVGIHSRIGNSITANVHVPVDTYRDTFDRLAAGEVWGTRANAAYLGIQANPDSKECKVGQVVPGSPAEKAGLKVNDILLKCDGQKITTFDDLGVFLIKRKPGDEVSVEVRRGEETVSMKIVLGRKS